MSQPARKGSFMQTMLFAIVIFLLLQMMFGNKGTTETVQSNKLVAVLQTGSADEFKKALDASKGDPQQFKDLPDDLIRAMQKASPDQDLMALRVLDGLIEDPNFRAIVHDRATQLRGALDGRINFEKDAKKITPAAANLKELEGMVLIGDMQYKAGILLHKSDSLTQAFYMLHGQDKRFGEAAWATTTFQLTPTGQFPESTTTVKNLYDKTITELRTQFQTELTWGLVPGFRIIDFLVKATGAVPIFSYAFAAILLAFIVRAIVWPLTQKQYRFGRQMAQLQPLIKDLRTRYQDKKSGKPTDVQEMNKKMMELYAEYGVNPMAGCLPLLIQMPFFLFIYGCMQQYRFEFQKGTFLWINESFSHATNGFIAPNLGEKDYILIGIYAVSMVITTLLTPVSDPSNARQQRIMGVSMAGLFSIMMFFYPLPSAFVLYWVALNVFATGQMLYIYRQPVPALVKKRAPGGGIFPTETAPITVNGQPKATGKPVKHKPKKKR